MMHLSLQTLTREATTGRPAAGSRARAIPLRQQIEQALDLGQDVELDFVGIDATQSFIDELIGLAVLGRGPSLLEKVSFTNCSPDLKAIIRFVVGDRLQQYAQKLNAAH